MREHVYIAIDLKSFYASVECREAGLDPLDACLVVADESRTDKTICLAVSPALKRFGIPGRARLFEVKELVRRANAQRQEKAPGRRLEGASRFGSELAAKPSLSVDFFVARPRMALYMEYSTRIYGIYLKYAAPEDIVVYSIDEVFMDAAPYLTAAGTDVWGFTRAILREILEETGITATAGIGSNLYLAKIAMDIMAKRMPADEHGARIASLTEKTYRQELWGHTPLTDFWRFGRGTVKRLNAHGIMTMGDLARRSLTDEALLYRLFGKNAELLIDHAWGREPVTMKDIHAYRPESRSLSSGQVLSEPYTAVKALIIVKEMADSMTMELVDKGLVTDLVTLSLNYDTENLNDASGSGYRGEITRDYYGRRVPEPARGSQRLPEYTSSAKKLIAAFIQLFQKIDDPRLTIRRVNLTAEELLPEKDAPKKHGNAEQLDLFTDYEAREAEDAAESEALARERRRAEALLSIRKRFGANAVLRGTSLEEGATGRDRNEQIGGHRK